MHINVEYLCMDNGDTGKTKINVTDFDSKSIRDIKYAIQGAIQVPACDQRLFYQGLLQADDELSLKRLYFREGDWFKVECVAFAYLKEMDKILHELKSVAREITVNFHSELPVLTSGYDLSIPTLHDRIGRAIEGLSPFIFQWKSLRSVVQRHYFVQEGGFDAFLEVFRFVQKMYPRDPVNTEDTEFLVEDLSDEDIFNEEQRDIQLLCFHFLWNFSETPSDRKFVLSKNVLPSIIDTLLLQSRYPDESINEDYNEWLVDVSQLAVGCCAGLVECDPVAQETASRTTPLIDKLLFMTDRSQSSLAGYSRFSSQVASNTLFYCTFNIKSAPLLVEGGVVPKMIDITRTLLNDEYGDIPLRYYCCLFLARMRSSPLVSLDEETAAAIDELIEKFLEEHVPDEISAWEEDMSYVWMTVVPLAHLSFAAGKHGHHGNCRASGHGNSKVSCHGNGTVSGHDKGAVSCHGNGTTSGHGNGTVSDHGNSTVSGHGNSTFSGHGNGTASCHGNGTASGYGNGTVSDHGNSTISDHGNSSVSDHGNSTVSDHGNSTVRGHGNGTASGHGNGTASGHGNGTASGHGNGTASVHGNVNSNLETKCSTGPNDERSFSENEHFSTNTGTVSGHSALNGNTVLKDGNRNACSTWPGSLSTQKLGIFSLQHMLSIKENQQLAESENLLSYLGCLLWHVNAEERMKLSESLSNCENVSVPSLKVAAKSVLALMYGLDMVINQ